MRRITSHRCPDCRSWLEFLGLTDAINDTSLHIFACTGRDDQECACPVVLGSDTDNPSDSNVYRLHEILNREELAEVIDDFVPETRSIGESDISEVRLAIDYIGVIWPEGMVEFNTTTGHFTDGDNIVGVLDINKCASIIYQGRVWLGPKHDIERLRHLCEEISKITPNDHYDGVDGSTPLLPD